MKTKSSINGTTLVLFSFILIIILSVSLTIFHQTVVMRIHKLTIQNIYEFQELYKQSVQSKFKDLFDMLEAQGRYFTGIDLHNEEALKRTIKTTKGIGEFKKLYVSDKNGHSTDYTGRQLPNIMTKDFFRDTFTTGQGQISNRIELDDNLEPVLTLTYPLCDGNKTEAAILGTISYNALKNLFSSEILNGLGYSFIITRSGNIILCNSPKVKNIYNINFFNYINKQTDEDSELIIKMKSDVSRNARSYAIHKTEETKEVLVYEPLGTNNWYIITAIPYSFVNNQKAMIEVPVYIIVGIITVAIFLFILILFMLFKKSTLIENDNERLTIAATNTQSMIFEYNIPKGVIDFSGDTKFILGTDRTNFPIEFVRKEYYRRVHPDDYSIFEYLQTSVDKSLADFTSEFRYKTFSEEYVWLRMSGSIICDKDGNNDKFIGTINNVNAQVLHEQELKSIAELDKLTMLLNKATMENRINKFINEEAEETTGALFIIDLDNFKAVNDNLGHLIGDQAIKDAGKKLSLIFSEKDFISRFGGDEFCILLRLSNSIGAENIKKIIKEKAKTICTMIPETYSDQKCYIHVTASVGVATFPANGSTYEDLFEEADKALYEVKQGGKNNFKIAK